MEMNEQNNYDEYNRNNKIINNIRFNNRYNDIDNNINNNYNTLRMNSPKQELNQNTPYQNEIIYQNQNNNQNNINNNNSQNLNNNETNYLNNKTNKYMVNTINNNRFNNGNSNLNYNNNENIINDDNKNNNLNEQRSVNINISSNENENGNKLYKSNDINIDLNEWVRKDLESRGLHIGRGLSPRSIRLGQLDKRKTLLENIKAQINLKKKTKLEELNKRKQEDAKYLQDMVIYYPFGRGGGGAPNRDKSGNVITYRRALISDPKYNFASINVDDDYDEVWNREKRIGRFYRNSPESFNQNQNENNMLQMNDNNNNSNNYNPNNYMPNNNISNNYIPSNNFNSINFSRRNQLSRSTTMESSPEFNNFNNQFRMGRRTPYIERNRNEMNAYNELLLKLREQNEILKRQLEEERENERIRKEKEKEEEQKKLEELKEREREIKEREENEINIIEENNNVYKNKIIEKEIIDPDSIILDKNAIERINRSEIESRNKLNNEIYRLRAQMQDQQMLLYQQISNLKMEAEKANTQREEALREIEKLKLQIYQDNKEDRQKRYIHHVIVSEDGDKNVEKSIQTEQPKNNEDALELNKLLKKNIDRLNYLEEIERLNAIRRSPPSNYELEFPKNNVVPEKEEEDDDLYEIEISKVHN